MKDLTNLRKIAEAATPGKWITETHCAYEGDDGHAVYDIHSEKVQVISQLGCGCCDVGLEVTKPDAVFVTTFDPPSVLALITRLEQAEQAVARVREAHKSKRITEYNVPVFDEFDSPTVTHNGCTCGSHYYPCPTLRALDGDTRG